MLINGNSSNNTLNGTAAADTINGLAGNDRLNGLGGADILDGGDGLDTLYGGDLADILRGGAGNDSLFGDAGDDTLDGGTGTDRIDGGAGIDTALYTVNTTALLVNLTTGLVSFPGQTWPSETLVSIENIQTGSGNDTITGGAVANLLTANAGNDSLFGDAGNDTLLGGSGNDILDGGTGTDRIDGGDGTDTALYTVNTTPLTVNLATGTVTFTGQTWPSETLVSIENIETGSGNDTITGSLAANLLRSGDGYDVLSGGDGNDTLDGGQGYDTLNGGAGNDSFYVDSQYDSVVEAVSGTAGGTDTVYSTGESSYDGYIYDELQLAANVENLTLLGVEGSDGRLIGIGNSLANMITGSVNNDYIFGVAGNDTLYGGGGNDTLDGGTGTDRLDGGTGNDTADYRVNTSSLLVNLSTGSVTFPGQPWSGETIVSIESLWAGSGSDSVTGTSAGNLMEGFASSDSLTGAGGDDTLSGGSGNDTIKGGDGNDFLSGGFQGVIDLWYDSEYSYDNVTYLDGRDTIDGGTGTDTLVYGHIIESGDYDYYSFYDYSVIVDLNWGSATLTEVSGHDDTLVSIENVITGSGDDTVFGNSEANFISVSFGSNHVHAAEGNDTIHGGAGSELGNDGDGFEYLEGGGGNDTIFSYGSATRINVHHYEDYFIGIDTLVGGDGNDRLVGGYGMIDMFGGAGADRFEFSSQTEFWDAYVVGDDLSKPGIDITENGIIRDFSRQEGDKIVLSGLSSGDFVGESSDISAGQLGWQNIVDQDGIESVLIKYVFYSSDPSTAMTIELQGYTGSINANDFVFA